MTFFDSIFYHHDFAGANCIGGHPGENCIAIDPLPPLDTGCIDLKEENDIPAEPIECDLTPTLKNNYDHFEKGEMSCEITSQRMGGADVQCDKITFFDEDNQTIEFANLTGKNQMWSMGVMHYDLFDENGCEITFNKNPDGTITDFSANTQAAE